MSKSLRALLRIRVLGKSRRPRLCTLLMVHRPQKKRVLQESPAYSASLGRGLRNVPATRAWVPTIGGCFIQIQDDFSGAPLSKLARSGLGIYDFVPTYQRCCPLCGGRGCAVRHGIYRRRVADRDGAFYEQFPIPRFRCRRRGPKIPGARTFSVLPIALVSRHLPSLALMNRILEMLLETPQSARELLDTLAQSNSEANPWLPEAPTFYRIAGLFARAAERLRPAHPPVFPESASGDLRARIRNVFAILGGPHRAAPVALLFHRLHFPRLLFTNSRP